MATTFQNSPLSNKRCPACLRIGCLSGEIEQGCLDSGDGFTDFAIDRQPHRATLFCNRCEWHWRGTIKNITEWMNDETGDVILALDYRSTQTPVEMTGDEYRMTSSNLLYVVLDPINQITQPAEMSSMLSRSVENGVAAAMGVTGHANYNCDCCKDTKSIRTKSGVTISCPACVEEKTAEDNGVTRASRSVNI